MRGRVLISRRGMAAVLLLLAMLAVGDGVLTSVVRRSEVRALSDSVPATTAYMSRASRAGHPVRDYRWVPLAAVPPVAACAVVMAEDEEFFNKGTVSWRAQRVLLQRMLRGDFSRGGSGLSQQLARNLFLSADRTPRRKAREYLLAYELSHNLSKVRILELYLNMVEWGDGIWGIDAASRRHFGIGADSLTATQAIILASFLPAPRRELGYVLGNLASNRQEAIARKLWKARLLSDRGLGATLDRIREWRVQARMAGDASEGWLRTTEVMGAERRSVAAAPSARGAPPLPLLCDGRRRGI